jgi:hypothetical protein
MERRISIHQGDVLSFACDVLILKYAQGLYGADSAVFEKLADPAPPLKWHLPNPKGFGCAKSAIHSGKIGYFRRNTIRA